MIIYDKLWILLSKKKISQYKLITSGISHSTLDRLKKNQPVNTETLNKLCTLLNCKIEEIIEYKPN